MPSEEPSTMSSEERQQCQLACGRILEEPDSIDDLIHLFVALESKCSCAGCQSEPHDSECCERTHAKEYHQSWEKGSQCRKFIPPDIGRHLAFAINTSTGRNMTPAQHEALAEVQDLISAQFHGFGVPDARECPPETVMRIIQVFNKLLFENALVIKNFAWKCNIGGADSKVLGQQWNDKSGSAFVEMDPEQLQIECEDAQLAQLDGADHCVLRIKCRLACLLHELTHAYLGHYSCRKCPSYAEHVVQLRGHGKMFWKITSAIQKFFARELFVLPPLVRPDLWLWNWKHLRNPLSGHEMEELGWLTQAFPTAAWPARNVSRPVTEPRNSEAVVEPRTSKPIAEPRTSKPVVEPHMPKPVAKPRVRSLRPVTMARCLIKPDSVISGYPYDQLIFDFDETITRVQISEDRHSVEAISEFPTTIMYIYSYYGQSYIYDYRIEEGRRLVIIKNSSRSRPCFGR